MFYVLLSSPSAVRFHAAGVWKCWSNISFWLDSAILLSTRCRHAPENSRKTESTLEQRTFRRCSELEKERMLTRLWGVERQPNCKQNTKVPESGAPYSSWVAAAFLGSKMKIKNNSVWKMVTWRIFASDRSAQIISMKGERILIQKIQLNKPESSNNFQNWLIPETF